jgi:hypothetical protein
MLFLSVGTTTTQEDTMATVKLTEAQAQYIADTLAPNATVEIDGGTVTLGTQALDLLAALDDGADGHYDGTYIWIGGSEYRVRRPAGRPAKPGRHYPVRLTDDQVAVIRAAADAEGIKDFSEAVATFAVRQVN